VGASDRSGMWQVDNTPQEIVTACYEIDDETGEEMLQFLEERGIEEGRVTSAFNTWKGRYFLPPTDEPPWSKQEYEEIVGHLEEHPNVRLVDTSPGAGSEG